MSEKLKERIGMVILAVIVCSGMALTAWIGYDSGYRQGKHSVCECSIDQSGNITIRK